MEPPPRPLQERLLRSLLMHPPLQAQLGREGRKVAVKRAASPRTLMKTLAVMMMIMMVTTTPFVRLQAQLSRRRMVMAELYTFITTTMGPAVRRTMVASERTSPTKSMCPSGQTLCS